MSTCVRSKKRELEQELLQNNGRRPFWSDKDYRRRVFVPVLGAQVVNNLATTFEKRLDENLDKLCKGQEVELPYEQDRRTSIRYLYDTVDGWYTQELVRKWLEIVYKNLGKPVQIKTVGKDANFRFRFSKTTGKEISSDPDLKIEYYLDSKVYFQTYVEVQWSASGRRFRYHMKQNKVNTLCKRKAGINKKNKKGVFLWFVPGQGVGYTFVVPCSFLLEKGRFIPRHKPFGGKPALEIEEKVIKEKGYGYFRLGRQVDPRFEKLLGPE